MTSNWIGNWSPGIGDPSLIGWLTVVLYFAAAFAAFRLIRTRRASFDRSELWFWRGLAFALVALGINKQFDLQTAFTELGRVLAYEQGWYEERRGIQRLFIVGMALFGVVASVLVAVLVRRTPPATKLTLIGIACLLVFVVVRASSFHHVDGFLGQTALGLRWNWILEVGGISLVLLATHLRKKAPPSRTVRATSGSVSRIGPQPRSNAETRRTSATVAPRPTKGSRNDR